MSDNMSKAMLSMLPSLEQKFNQSPKDSTVMKRLGEIYRQLGKLAEAEKIYRKLLAIDRRDPYVATINNQPLELTQNNWTEDCFWPVPFVHQKNVFSEQMYSELLQWCHSKESKFELAKVSATDSKRVDLEFRNQLVYDCINSELDWIINKFKSTITESISAFGLGSNEFNIHGAQISLTQRNGFGRVHSDGAVDRKNSPIKAFSFLYYLASDPQKFSGGDLLLHDTNFKLNSHKPILTKIPFSSNSLIFFPRYFFHEINQVRSPSPISWKDGRFAIFINVEVEETCNDSLEQNLQP